MIHVCKHCRSEHQHGECETSRIWRLAAESYVRFLTKVMEDARWELHFNTRAAQFKGGMK